MQRQRLTITLDTDTLTALDSLVDDDTLRNRSHAIEHYLKQGLGLHQLRQAFLFLEAGWEQDQLEKVLDLCSKTGITTLYLCLPSKLSGLASEVEASIAQKGGFTTQFVPTDFGSGAAVLLQKAQLDQPFLLCWFTHELKVPDSLLLPYLFHTEHRSILTMLLSSNNALEYRASGLSIAQPELTSYIQAGISSLATDVFPLLLKDGKVRGYTASS